MSRRRSFGLAHVVVVVAPDIAYIVTNESDLAAKLADADEDIVVVVSRRRPVGLAQVVVVVGSTLSHPHFPLQLVL